MRRAAARGVQRNEGIEQERHVITAGIDITLVDIDHIGQRIEIGDRRTVRVVHDRPIGTAIRDAQNFVQRLAVGVLDRGVIEFPAHDEIQRRAFLERRFRQRGNVRADEGDFQLRIGCLHGSGQLDVPLKSRRAGEEHQKLELFADLDGLGGIHLVRRGVQQTRALQHSGRVGEPYRIPVRLDFAGGWPARTGATIIVLERRGIEK